MKSEWEFLVHNSERDRETDASFQAWTLWVWTLVTVKAFLENDWKFPTLAHFTLSYGPSATSNTSLPSFQIRRQFYTLITQYIHGNKEMREELTKRIYFECDRPNTSLIYVTQLQKINRRYHWTVHNATWSDQCTDGHWRTPLQSIRRFRLPSRRWWGPRLNGMLRSSGDSWLPKRRQPTTNPRGVNIPEEQSPQLERSEQIPPILVTSVLILKSHSQCSPRGLAPEITNKPHIDCKEMRYETRDGRTRWK